MAKTAETSELGLKRELGLLDTVSIEVGGIIGAGIFALTGMAIGMCGAAVPIAFLIAALPMVFAIIPLGMLASALPTVGGSFRYPSRIFSPFWGFLGVWGIMMGILLGGLPLYAYTFADYLLILFPSLSRVAVAVVALTFFFLVNLVGIRTAGSVQVAMFVILMIALLTYIAGGLPNIEISNLTPMFSQGFMGIAIASGLLFFAYMGANFIIDLGAEIKNAGRNIPLSFAISIPIVIVIYTLIGLVDVGVVPCEMTANQPLSVSAGNFLSGPLATFFTVGGGLLAMATTLNATFMFGARYILVFADDEVVPKCLAAVSKRFATPHWGLLFMFLVSLLAMPLGTKSLTIFGITASIGSIVLLIPILIAAFLLPRRMPSVYDRASFKLKGFWLWLLPALAMLFGVFFVAALGMESPLGFILFVAWMVVGITYYFVRNRYLKAKRGTGLDAIAHKGI
ncbi:MAG: amino acid permease [Chloroflexi bacterium]|nr:amino acid permease [Chloroflexota bacterium]MBM4452117.1 amino acid permease [Chloroflexota bacterium]MBM4454073.1 amino acid permease [Chloroflexota bacterium]